jgi:hypothetical protein
MRTGAWSGRNSRLTSPPLPDVFLHFPGSVGEDSGRFGWVSDSVGFGPIESDSWPSTSVTLLKVDSGYIWIRFRVRFTRILVDSTTLNPNHHPRHFCRTLPRRCRPWRPSAPRRPCCSGAS